MPLIRGKVVLILGFVFLTTFLAAVRGLPVRGKPRSNTPKERSSKLAEVGRSLGKYGEVGECWGELFLSLCTPSRARESWGGQPGTWGSLPRRQLCISDGSSIQHVSRGSAAQSSEQRSSSGEKQGPPIPLVDGCFLTRWGTEPIPGLRDSREAPGLCTAQRLKERGCFRLPEFRAECRDTVPGKIRCLRRQTSQVGERGRLQSN